MRSTAAARVLVLFLVLLPSAARADVPKLELVREQAAPHGSPDALATFLVGATVLALGGVAALAGMARAAPASLVAVAWPSLAPCTSDAPHPPTWSVPDGGRKPMLFATLVDVRF